MGNSIEKEYQMILDLVSRLDKSELRILKRYLEISVKEAKPLKTTQLLELLLSKRGYSCGTVQDKLGYSDRDHAFKSFLDFFSEKVCFSLTLDLNIMRKDRFSNVFKQELLCRDRISQARILVTKGNLAESKRQLQKVLRASSKYELLDIGFTAAMEMGDLAYGREGVEEGDIWGQLVSEYAKKIEYRERARRLFYVIQYRILFSAGDHSLLQDFKHELKNLEVMLGEYDLAQVGYYYYHVAMIYLAELGEHELAESKCDSLIDLLKSRPAISMPRRFGSTHIHMAKFQIQQSKFTDAIRSGKVAAIHCAMSSNLGECYVVQCYAHIYRGDYQLAIKAARKALELTAEKDEPIRFAERTYLKACAYFLMGEHYHAHVGLQKETKELDKDKQGYKVAISILNIMNQIAWRGAMTNADNYIDALRKRVQRNRDRFTLSARFMTIIEILKALQLHGYDFGVVSKTHAVEIKSLQSQEKGEAWYFLAPEVVRFDLWFSSMAERRPYKLVV